MSDGDGRALELQSTGSPDTEQALRAYLMAKDHNRPIFMPQAFAADAVLTTVVKTDAIDFPPTCRGLLAITDTLVTNFGRTYEDVFTFYCSRPPTGQLLPHFSCIWLVGMREKSTGDVRVGCGTYNWDFAVSELSASRRGCKATGLVIAVEEMVTLPPDTTPAIFRWLMGLPYPFCEAKHALAYMPSCELLSPVVAFLGRHKQSRL